MVGHYTPGKNLHSLLSLAKLKAVNKYILILISGKGIYPLHYGKAYKVNPIRVMELVVSTHGTNIATLFATLPRVGTRAVAGRKKLKKQLARTLLHQLIRRHNQLEFGKV